VTNDACREADIQEAAGGEAAVHSEGGHAAPLRVEGEARTCWPSSCRTLPVQPRHTVATLLLEVCVYKQNTDKAITDCGALHIDAPCAEKGAVRTTPTKECKQGSPWGRNVEVLVARPACRFRVVSWLVPRSWARSTAYLRHCDPVWS